jgi:hypothetical protein
MKQYLTPSINDLEMECVLMQAWKKTSAYGRPRLQGGRQVEVTLIAKQRDHICPQQ